VVKPHDQKLRMGLAGLGAASTHILRAIDAYANMEVAAACDVREEARRSFEATRDAKAFDSVEAMAKSDLVDAVYVATPNYWHCEHVIQAVENGKDVIVEKPLAITMEECDRMVEATQKAGVRVLAGHTHSFDAPIVAMANIIASGRLGEVYMINNQYYTDWMVRGRAADEYDTARGGGVVFRQGPHGLDILRILAQRPATRVLARTSELDPRHPTHGSYTAFIEFGPDLCATITFSGYGFFDSPEITWGRGELGCPRPLETNGRQRRKIFGFASAEEEQEYKNACRFMGGEAEDWLSVLDCDDDVRAQPFYGVTIVSGSKGDLRQSEHGLYLYDDNGRNEIEVPTAMLERDAELDMLYKAWRDDAPLESHDIVWARDTMKIVFAIIESGKSGQPVDIR
jgi:phthalate 4,5-cis-dihydrodiol dehydrogenase